MGLVRREASLFRLGVAITFVTWIPLLVLTLTHQFTSGSVAKAFALSLGYGLFLAPGRRLIYAGRLVFSVVRNMRIVPFGFGIVANILAFAAGPMLLLLLFEFSIDEL